MSLLYLALGVLAIKLAFPRFAVDLFEHVFSFLVLCLFYFFSFLCSGHRHLTYSGERLFLYDHLVKYGAPL